MSEGRNEQCSWCGTRVERDDGWRALEPAGERRAVFCRLEHVVPWFIQGPHWDAGTVPEPPGLADSIDRCAHCSDRLGEVPVYLIRHRGEHRVPDGFCSTEHMKAWAAAGGRWR